nr:ABC transporter permease [Limibaculum sediminis]
MAGSLRVALRSLSAHPLRSALTILGIVIGIASVVVIIATGTGARERIAEQIGNLGANLVSINPGSARDTSVRLGSSNSPMLSEDDAAAIAREIPGLVAVAPVLYARAQFTAGPRTGPGASAASRPTISAHGNGSWPTGRK